MSPGREPKNSSRTTPSFPTFAAGIMPEFITPTSAYGAAGSLVIVLWWVYYSAQILFFGAKFTQLYADQYSSHLEPVPGVKAALVEEAVSEPSHSVARP